MQLLCAFKQLRFSSFYHSLFAYITFFWFSQQHAVVFRFAAVMWRCIHSYVHSHYNRWNLHTLIFIGETIGVRANKNRLSRLGFSNVSFRVFATVVFLQKTQVFSFYLSLSASITFLPSTFHYLHLLLLFLLPFFIYIYLIVFSLLHLLHLFLLPFFICINFSVFSLLHILVLFVLPFFIYIYFMAFSLLLEIPKK